jgi:hypothetical protein
MFKHRPKFDRKNGEIRTCNVCSKEFHTLKPLFRCKFCTNEFNKKETKRKLEEGLIEALEHKQPYPFDTTNGEAGSRFRRIQKALDGCNSREERRELFHKQLQEAEELGILLWIYDRRDSDTKKETQSKSRGMIKKDYPDTRNMTWDDYEREGLGEPEDS